MAAVDLTRVDVRLAVTDAPVGDLPWFIACREPRHQDDTTSLAVYADHLHCFGCQLHIPRRMDSLAYVLGVGIREAIALAPKYTSEALDAYRERAGLDARRDPLPRSLADAYSALLWGGRRSRVPYLTGRGLTPDAIRLGVLGHTSSHFAIPFFDADNHLLTIRFRRDDAYGTTTTDPSTGQERPTPKYLGMRGRNGCYLYGEWLLARDRRDWVVVTEGEFDALVLWSHDIPAVTITNGAGQVHRVPGLLRQHFPHLQRLFVATDMDEPGEVGAQGCIDAARGLGMRAGRLRWDREFGKDVTELFVGGRTLRDAGYET